MENAILFLANIVYKSTKETLYSNKKDSIADKNKKDSIVDKNKKDSSIDKNKKGSIVDKNKKGSYDKALSLNKLNKLFKFCFY